MPTRTAIVTGAARGIGQATARILQAQGLRVALIDRDADALAEAADALPGSLPCLCDVSQPDQVDQMAAEMTAKLGRVDVLINNAGVADFGPLEDTDFQRWRRVMETNLDGVFLCSQALLPALKSSHGAIVNIASISGLRLDAARGLRHLEGGRYPSDPTTSGRIGRVWNSCQLCCPWPSPHQAGNGSAQRRDYRRLSRCHSAKPLWERRRDCRGDQLSGVRKSQFCHRPADCL